MGGRVVVALQMQRILLIKSLLMEHTLICLMRLVRNAENDIVEAFSCQLNNSAALNAEIWGCIWGLRRAWDLGLRDIKLFCDSTKVLSLVNSSEINIHEDKEAIFILRSLLNREWEVSLLWVHREGNLEADFFARRALGAASSFNIFSRHYAEHLLGITGVT